MPMKRNIDVIFYIDEEPRSLKFQSVLVGIHDKKKTYVLKVYNVI